MPKRRATEPLEDSSNQPSPASKKARVKELKPEHTQSHLTNGSTAIRDSRVEEQATASSLEPAVPKPPSAREKNGITQEVAQDVRSPDGAASSEAFEDAPEEQMELSEDDDLQGPVPSIRQTAPTEGYSDLYLDTINRTVLDFDFEKLCSVTLSNINVYACLVCGRYFQGRGPKSQAYFHALEDSHHVYINMESKKVYVLPEGYEVKSNTLEDIKYVVDPHFAKQDVLKGSLDKEPKTAWDLNGKPYTPGFVGMNNIKANDYFNVITHALAHVPPLRNFFILENLSSTPQLAQRFGILVRKIWNSRAFKSHVSPHELLQEVTLRSSKRFNLTEQSDPVDFLSWFLNNLHSSLGGHPKKPRSSMVQRVFQGSLKVESQAITARADASDRLRFEDADVQSTTQNFMILTLDLPAAPLFADALDPTNVIPQVPLSQLLSKYDGIHAQERLNTRVRYRLLHPLPPYLIFHIKRFSKNKFVSERNPTIVTFPTRSLDLSPYIEPTASKLPDGKANPNYHPAGEPILYDLLANVTHEAVKIRDDSVEGEAEKKVWRVQLKDKSRDNRWVEVQDLYVNTANAETLYTKESVVLVWEKRRTKG